jgi:hypothetical protein
MAQQERKRNVSGNAVTDGRRIDYLGYCFNHETVRMRKSIKQTFARKDKRVQTAKKRRELRASYWGWSKWGNCRNLWNTITAKDMSFIENGIKGRIATKDGKEFYDVRQVKSDVIPNVDVTVKSFIRDITTKHGGGRYAILMDMHGEEVKLITNSCTLKSQCEQALEKGVLPTETHLRRKDIGSGKYDFYFD